MIVNNYRVIDNEIKKLNPTKIEWCMNKDDVPPQEIFNLHKTGGPSGRAKVAKYCIQDCELCIHLINLLDIIPNNIGMSNVCLVPFSYIFLRGQGIKVTSFVSKECNVQNTRMPTLKDYKETTDGYEGAIVLEPKTGIYLDDPIAVLDYASLYPSSIIENNLSQDKYLSNNNPYLQKCKDDGTFDERIEMIEYDDYQYIKRGKGDTDSVFVKFSRKDKDGNILSGDTLLKHCIRCGIEAGKFVDNRLRNPQNLEYEKTFFPFILISKKRYVGDKYEWESDVDNRNFKRTSMGIVMKRRDNAPIVKYVFGNIIEKIMIDKNFTDALNWLQTTLSEISDGKFPISYFIISKSLRGYYKNPKSIAHKVLADRIGERDPGNKPKSNDRIPYAYIKMTNYDKVFDRNSQYKSGKNKGRDRKQSILQGDRIEHPDFIHSENLILDYSFYIENQIMNPVKQVLDLNTQYLTLTQTIFDSYIVTDDMLYKDMEKYK